MILATLLRDARLREPPIYHFARMTCEAICLTIFRMKVYGRENVPVDGPLIVASNHRSYLDPVALGSGLPRPISYMAKVELFRIPVLGPLISALETYPVDRSRGDIAAIRTSVRRLEAGWAIGIFPEGTRNLTGTGESHTGVALLASLTGAPVLPTFVWGGDRAKRLGQLRVAYGEPIRFPKGKASRDDLAKWKDEIMARIRALGEKLGAD